MNIWMQDGSNEPEKIEECAKADALYLVTEYRMAFNCSRTEIRVWSGLKRDAPNQWR